MKTLHSIACLVIAFAAFQSSPAEEAKLEPNAKLTFEFPDLPETFFSRSTHEKTPAQLSAQLPENYSPEGKFPLFVFLNGGNGGKGDCSAARNIVGTRDFIAVNMPLFKDSAPEKAPQMLAGAGIDMNALISANDATVLGASYKIMLQKLFDAVPNTATDRSVFGGFSNGAHATAALIAAKDEFLLNHFKGFCLFEGGMALAINPTALQNPALKGCRILLLFGDHDENPKLQVQRALLAEPLLGALEKQAAAVPLDFTHVTMHGYGHTMPPEYLKLLGNWIRGEKLPDLERH